MYRILDIWFSLFISGYRLSVCLQKCVIYLFVTDFFFQKFPWITGLGLECLYFLFHCVCVCVLCVPVSFGSFGV